MPVSSKLARLLDHMSWTLSKQIGIFDSGVGGLSVLLEIRKTVPWARLIYVGDQVHVPYGRRSIADIQGLSAGIVKYLEARECNLVVVACNTASAAALSYLRERFPALEFVGMEPAVKPAASLSRSKVVGVLATPATFEGKLFASVVERFGGGLNILTSTCPGLVECIEAGDVAGERPQQILSAALIPMKRDNADVIVLGCTHYPFVAPLVRQIMGEGVRIVDPAPAVARRVADMGEDPEGSDAGLVGSVEYRTTGDVKLFAATAELLVGGKVQAGSLVWRGGGLESRSG